MTESSVAALPLDGYAPSAAGQPASQQRYYMWGPPPPYSNPNSPARTANPNTPASQPLLNIVAASSQNMASVNPGQSSGAPLGPVNPRYHHFQHHHHLHHHHHHCQLQAQQLQTRATPALGQSEVLVGGSGLLKHLQQQQQQQQQLQLQRSRTCAPRGLRGFSPEGPVHCFEDVAPSCEVASSDPKNGASSTESYMNKSAAELEPSDMCENNTDSSSGKDHASNTLPARKAKKRLDISSVKSVANIPYSLGPGTPGTYPNPGNLPGMFPSGQHDSKMSIEEEYQEKEDRNGNPTNAHSHYIAGITNTAFQDQEGQASSKSDQTESEVYFADVSSCCNVSVRNDGQDSSLYDEAVDPQKRLMLMNRDGRGRVISLPTGQYPLRHLEHHSLHHPLLGSENTLSCVNAEETQLTTGCFSYARQGSCNRIPYALVRHPIEGTDDRMCSQVCSRDYLSQVTKDPSVSSSNGTPLTETASPMSVSTSSPSPSPANYPPDSIVNCVTYYREGSVMIGEKDTNTLCPRVEVFPALHKSIPTGQSQQRSVEFSDNHFLAPDAQYETISSPPQQYPCHLQEVFSGREDFNGNTPPNSPGRTKLMPSSPSRRHLNLPLHMTTNGGMNANRMEDLYRPATSTEEEELDHQQQCSDATMDSGCHSGSEFAARHHRAPASGTASSSSGTKLSDDEDEKKCASSNMQVTNKRSVNV